MIWNQAIKDDSARPQIAQLTELGLVELTRKRQGQNIYELFGKKCDVCDGLGHLENFHNNKNYNLGAKNSVKEDNKQNNEKLSDLEPTQITAKQDKFVEKDSLNSKNLNKDHEISNKRENENEKLSTSNSKENKVITIELNNDEKLVYSQLGINPLIKLGKEYLVGNNVALLEDDSYKNDENLSKNDRKLKKKSSKTNKKNQDNNFKAEVHLEANDKNQETSFIEENKVNEITDEVDNSRRKRRRSSASSE